MLLTSFSAHAFINYDKGEWGSGGGNALVCFPEGRIAIGEEFFDVVAEIKKNQNTIPDKFLPFIESIEMYDLYEAKKRRGLNSKKPEILEIKEDERIYEYIDRLGKRFDKYNMTMSFAIPQARLLIPDSQFIFHEYAVKYQNDLGTVTLPNSNCVISTMAAQVFLDSRENGFYEVHIDQRLFNHSKHSYQSKATLVLHELIYGLARKHFDHKSSASTRNLVRFFISYDESFTEKFIANSVYNLGFYDKEDREANIVRAHYSSSTLTYVRFYNRNMKEKLDPLASRFIAREISALEYYNEVSDFIRYTTDDLRDTLSTESRATSADKRSISERFTSVFEELYLHQDFQNINLGLSSQELNEKVYDEILSGVVCEAESEPFPIPTLSKVDPNCTYPAALDSIIPKI